MPDEPKDAPSRQETLRAGVQFVRTHTRFAHRMLRLLSRHGLTGPQFDVLGTLHRGEGVTQQELATRLRVTRSNVTGVLDRMEALGWIERRPDPADRRVNRLSLTDAGRAMFQGAEPEHRTLIHEFMADFDAEEVRTFRRLLAKLEDGIEK